MARKPKPDKEWCVPVRITRSGTAFVFAQSAAQAVENLRHNVWAELDDSNGELIDIEVTGIPMENV